MPALKQARLDRRVAQPGYIRPTLGLADREGRPVRETCAASFASAPRRGAMTRTEADI